jgi:hypothetical protein
LAVLSTITGTLWISSVGHHPISFNVSPTPKRSARDKKEQRGTGR